MKGFFQAAILVTGVISLILSQGVQAAEQPAQRNQEPSIIYQIAADGKFKKVVAQMPYMHRGTISPSGRYVYAERIGYGKNDPTMPYLYDIQNKKLSQLSGFAKWSPKQDMLYIQENGGILRLNPADGKKTVLVEAVPQYPVLDFLVSPDEQYMVFFRKDEKGTDSSQATHLYLQHLPTRKMKINDRFAWDEPAYKDTVPLYWLPSSKKVFYRTKDAYKELDLPTGLKYVHKLNSFPSFSMDMKYRYVRENNEEYLLDLQSGKKVILQQQPQLITERYLDTISWSPVGHQFAAEEVFHPSGNAQDVYMRIRYYKEATKYQFPFEDVNEGFYHPYRSSLDNIRLIGWANDGKSYYVADWSSIHHFDFSPEKLDEYHRILER